LLMMAGYIELIIRKYKKRRVEIVW